MSTWNEKQFQQWLELRTAFRVSKKEKKWQKLIVICEEIIKLDQQAKFISIMTALFYREIARAHEKLNNNADALKCYILARESFLEYRTQKNLNKPDDWLDDIARIDKKISKLRLQLNVL